MKTLIIGALIVVTLGGQKGVIIKMTRTENLLSRASTCDRVALTAEECTQLITLVRLQHGALKSHGVSLSDDDTKVAEAIEAFNKFERGE